MNNYDLSIMPTNKNHKQFKCLLQKKYIKGLILKPKYFYSILNEYIL